MTDNFVVHLGGGAYLDATGKIVFGPPSGVQVYQAPKGFKFDVKKTQDAFKDLKDLLPADEDAKKQWASWGISENTIKMFSNAAAAAGVVVTAASIYFWIVGIMVTIMNLIAADDGMSPEVARNFQNLKNQAQGKEQIDRADNLIGMQSQFDGAVDQMQGLLTQLLLEKPVGSARANIFSQMQAVVFGLAQPLSNLRGQDWSTTFDPDSYNGRAFAAHVLLFEHSNGTLSSVTTQPSAATIFDYRLGVPMLLYGSTSFAALLQVAMPWFRSAGIFTTHLRKTAEAIDKFVVRMQDESLSHTEYNFGTLMQQDIWALDEIPMGGGPRTSNPFNIYAVGAFDLVAYNDKFLWDRFVAQFQSGLETGPRGLFNYHWQPPSLNMKYEDILKAANDQAHADYANLQVATGMYRLITTAAWLRFLSTPPDQSQTVSGYSVSSRIFLNESPTVAESPSIFPVGIIKHDATLKKYRSRARFEINTQEPGYVPAFRYRIMLRLLDSKFGTEGWRTQEYMGDVFQTSYEPTAGDPHCNRLRTEMRPNSVLSEIQLYEGPSPVQPVHASKVEIHTATTFDWYIPIVPKKGTMVREEVDTRAALKASDDKNKMTMSSGGVAYHLFSERSVAPAPFPVRDEKMPLRFNMGDEYFDPERFLSIAEVALEKAERRHVRFEQVTIGWELNWVADKLEVKISGDPDQRPFQVFIVVEERIYSGEAPPEHLADVLSDAQLVETLHTPVAADMVNQLVFVPEEFFEEESKAIKNAAKLWGEFARHYVNRGVVGPGDPIERVEQSINEKIRQSQSTSTLIANMDERMQFAKKYAPDLWNEVSQHTPQKSVNDKLVVTDG